MAPYLYFFIDRYDRWIKHKFPKGTKWSVTMHSDRYVTFQLEVKEGKRFGLVLHADELNGSRLMVELSAFLRKMEEANNDQT